MKLSLAFFLVVAVATPAPGQAPPVPRSPSAARLADPAAVRSRLGLSPEYDRVAGVENLKIAVLDYGFEGMDGAHGYLPAGAVVVEHYDADFIRKFDLGDPDFRKGFEPQNRHGRMMAQIVWAVTGSHPAGPKFFLLNANGPTMLRRAVRYAIEQRVDVILFSGSFEGGGNGDGRGPIDRVVSDAVAADILWINSAGNNHGRVYNGPVRVLSDGYLRLREGKDVASLRFRNRVDENTITVTLSWNDYRGDEDAGTTKDLDLIVEDWAGRRVGASEKKQVSGVATPGPDESLNPRERVVLTDLPASPYVPTDPEYGYRIRIQAKKGKFTSADRVRVLLTASKEVSITPGTEAPTGAVDFIDATDSVEIYPPADHPLALTVGDDSPDSSMGPTTDGRTKPDLILRDSRAYFTDGQVSTGSSNAAAYFAGIVATMKAAEPGLRTRHLQALARAGKIPMPSPPSTTRAASPKNAAQDLRIWQTPSRAKLAETVRSRI